LGRGTDWNRYEDGQCAQSDFHSEWDTDSKFTWSMEVREWVGESSLRLGTVHLQGSVDGVLTMRLETVWRD
jgi:hypothetical protein